MGKLGGFLKDHKSQIMGVVNKGLKGAVAKLPGGGVLSTMVGNGTFAKREGESKEEHKERVTNAVTAAAGAGIAAGEKAAQNPKATKKMMALGIKWAELKTWQKWLIGITIPLTLIAILWWLIKKVRSKKSKGGR